MEGDYLPGDVFDVYIYVIVFRPYYSSFVILRLLCVYVVNVNPRCMWSKTECFR